MFEVIIAGARCAGAALAAFLGQRGIRTLLIDKYTEPGPTLSTHIIGEIEVYERLGILQSMEQSGAPLISRMRVDINGAVTEADLMTTPRVIGLRRELLDPMLLEAAGRYSSVTVKLQMRVTSVIRQGGQVSKLTCMDHRGRVHHYYGKVVVGADGRDSMVARELQARILRQPPSPLHSVCYVYASGVLPQPLPTIEWYWHEDGIVIINPIDGDRHCIAVMVPNDRFKRWSKSLAGSFVHFLSSIRTLAPRIKNIQFAGTVRGIPAFRSFIKEAYGEGWVLVGDAGGTLHPVSGVGIDNAVCGAEALAAALDGFLRSNKQWDESMEAYKHTRDERIMPQYDHSLRTLAKTTEQVSNESIDMIRMLYTFPSMAKTMIQRSDHVYSLLKEEQA